MVSIIPFNLLKAPDALGAVTRMDRRFTHIRDWVFDLDNCLYPASTGLFALIDERMGAYIERLLDCGAEEAKRVQKAHFHAHGTTLAGLMRRASISTRIDFLADVHDIPLDRLKANERLARLLPLLPGRRFVFTNGDAPYARRVLEAIGVHRSFRRPSRHPCQRAFVPSPIRMAMLCCASGSASIRSARCWPTTWSRTLRPRKPLGMTTVWVDNGSEQRQAVTSTRRIVDVRMTDIADWLESILGDDHE